MKKQYLLLLIPMILFSYNQRPPADYLIKNGTIIDGLGNPAIKADLLIRNGTMEIVRPEESISAINTIDANGLIVSPGFVDVHNHSDQSINDSGKKLNEGFIRQGVTTIVGGPDGFWAPATLKKLIGAYDSLGIGTNVAFYVGHNGIRREVMKEDQQRPPTKNELDEMKALVREGLEMGAVGLSTGLMYEPGMFSTKDEVVELAKVCNEYGGIYDSHIRNPVFDWIGSNREVIEIGKKADIPAKMGHLKAVGINNAGKTKELIEIVKNARNEGIDVVSDQYPYDGAGGRLTLVNLIIPSTDREIVKRFHNEPAAVLDSLIQSEQIKDKIKSYTENGVDGGFSWIKAVGYTGVRIVDSPDYPELVGSFISEIADERNLESFELLCQLIIGAKSPIQVKGGISESDVRAILVQPWNMVASDGFFVKETDPDIGHPRSTGTFPRVLGKYVRELRLLSWEEAIRKMTSFPAEFVGLKKRGRIANCMPADIVIFDPEKIIDNSTYAQPNLYASGVVHVFVNGVPVLLDGEMTGNAPGKYLKRGADID